MHAVESGLAGRSAIAGIALLARPADDVEDALRIDLENAFANEFDKVGIARRVELDAEWLIHLGSRRRYIVRLGPAPREQRQSIRMRGDREEQKRVNGE